MSLPALRTLLAMLTALTLVSSLAVGQQAASHTPDDETHDKLVSARLERDLLREASSRRAAARRGTTDERADVAAWMLDKGLLTQAFAQLDGILKDDPDHPDARALLRRPDVNIRLPRVATDPAPPATREASLMRLLVYAGDAPQTLRELLLDSLEDAATSAHERQALRATLLSELRQSRPGRRAFAALAMRRLFVDELDVELLRRALLDPAADVRRSASLAVRDAHDPAWVDTCILSLEHPSSVLRTHAAEALGTMLEPSAVAPLVTHYAALSEASKLGSGAAPRGSTFFGTQRAFVQGFDAQVANRAAIADPLVGTLQEGAVLDARVLGTSNRGRAGERSAVRGALERITGASPGRNASAWKRWWQRHQAEWQADHPLASPVLTKTPAPAPSEAAGDAW